MKPQTINQYIDRLFTLYTIDDLTRDRGLFRLHDELLRLKDIYGGNQLVEFENDSVVNELINLYL